MADATPIQACIDRRLPDDDLVQTAEHAIAERTGNTPGRVGSTRAERVRLALDTGKEWRPGRTLRVAFLDGEPAVWERVEEVAVEWSDHANIGLEFDGCSDAEIRISFARGGSWSYVGTDALGVPPSRPTMNLGWLTADTPDDSLTRVVLHEFGHVLACIHEHQSPAGGIPWNRQAVYDYYAGPPNHWSKEQVDINLFLAYSGEQRQFTAFDPMSIMLYPIPSALTHGGFEVGWNVCLSETDKRFIAERYPHPDRSLRPLEVDSGPVDGAISVPGEINEYGLAVILAGGFVIETHGYTDLAMSLWGPDRPDRRAAEDEGGGMGGNARIETGLMEGTYIVRIRHQRATGTGRYQVSATRKPQRATRSIALGSPFTLGL